MSAATENPAKPPSSSLLTNLSYLINGSPSPSSTSNDPSSTSSSPKHHSKTSSALAAIGAAGGGAVTAQPSLRTRTILTTGRYVGKYVFYRIVRYLKYVVLGGIATALGGTFLATLSSGAAIFIAPSFLTATALGVGWGIVKFGYKHRPNSIRHFESRTLALLHLSRYDPNLPSTTSSTAAPLSGTPSSSSNSHSQSWLEKLQTRAARGADAKDDERRDHDGQAVPAETSGGGGYAKRGGGGDVWMRV